MKPFDLQKALAGEPVVTRDGRPVKIAGINPDAKDLYKVVGWLDGITAGWCIDGKDYLDGQNPKDLFMATKTVKKEGWVNLYKGGQHRHGSIFSTEDEAKKYAHEQCIATVKIEWEEEI